MHSAPVPDAGLPGHPSPPPEPKPTKRPLYSYVGSLREMAEKLAEVRHA